MSWRYVPSHQIHYNSPPPVHQLIITGVPASLLFWRTWPPSSHITVTLAAYRRTVPWFWVPTAGAAWPVGVKLSKDSYLYLCCVTQALLDIFVLLSQLLPKELKACCQTLTHCNPHHFRHSCVNPGPLLCVQGWWRGGWSSIWWPGHWLGSAKWGLRSMRVNSLRLGHERGHSRGDSTRHTLFPLLSVVGRGRRGHVIWLMALGGWTRPR